MWPGEMSDAERRGFEECVTAELVAEDGLALLADGLASERVLAYMATHHLHERALVLVLSSSEQQRSRLLRLLHCSGLTAVQLGSNVPSSERTQYYAAGGLVIVSTRITTVDMLTGVLPCQSIAGVCVLNAHRLRGDCNEAFICRMLRASGNSSAFVRALSDKPHWFPRGLNGPESVLQSIQVRQLYLWPRFEKRVEHSLSAGIVNVEEWSPQLGVREQAVQDAIKDAMGLCLNELKRSRFLDVSDLSVEDGLFKTLDATLMAQLEPKWHSVPKSVKQVVSDLKTLRRLAESCLRYDAATFLRFLEAMRVSEPHASFWLLSSAAQKLFENAKARVFHLSNWQSQKAADQHQCPPNNQPIDIDDASPSSSSPSKEDEDARNKYKHHSSHATSANKLKRNNNYESQINVVLEPLPKWTALQNAVSESEQEGDEHGRESRIVVVACDGATVNQLRGLLHLGQEMMLRDAWQRYLQTKEHLKHKSQRLPHTQLKERRNGAQGKKTRQKETDSQRQQQVHKQRQRKECWRRMKQCGAAPNTLQQMNNEEGNNEAGQALEEQEALEQEAERERKAQANETADFQRRKRKREADHHDHYCSDNNTGECSTSCAGKNIHIISQDGTEENVLDDVEPSHVVVYDPDLALVRKIEVYAARFKRSVKVHFIAYDGSLERDRYIASVKREQQTFADLIYRKSKMSLPELAQAEEHSKSSTVRNPRKAGGQVAGSSALSAQRRRRVIIDLREFMSSLPSTLHAQDIAIEPLTLPIGDYLLSKGLCVERKAVPDLLSSLNSGRLHAQAEEICKYYSVPCLLIEFEAGKPFCLVPPSDVPNEIMPTSTTSKLSLLVLQHPKLRILWSPSMQSTARLFNVLQMDFPNDPAPPSQQQDGSAVQVNAEKGDVATNENALELLKRLPGITERNYAHVLEQCSSVAELSQLNEESLAHILGDAKQASRLHGFLHTVFPTTTV